MNTESKIKILLCCAAGMSTSIIVKAMRKKAALEGKNYDIKAMDQELAEVRLAEFDVVLIGPQLGYILERLQSLSLKNDGPPVDVINQMDYGTNNAEAILHHAEFLVRQAVQDRKNKKIDWEDGKKKILLCCAAGMSTSLLVTTMKASAKEQGIDCTIWAVGTSEVNQELDKADVLLLGPQVRYLLSHMKKLCEPRGIPVDSINPVHYGLCNGLEVLKQATELIKGA